MNISPQRWLRSGVLTLGAFILLLGGQSAAAESKEAPPSKEEPPEFRFDFGLFGGGHFFDNNHSLGRAKESPRELSPASGGVFGGRLGLHFNRWFGLEAEVDATPTHTRNHAASMWVFGYRGNLILNLTDSYVFQPFILAGYGGLTSLVDNSNTALIVQQDIPASSTWGFMHAGLGFKVGFTPWTGLRVDGRIMAPWTALAPVISEGNRIHYSGPDFEVLGSLFVNFGEIEKVHIFKETIRELKPTGNDRDGDGIPDDLDKCPNEPEDKDGFQDEDGCPDPDNDNDGVPDIYDACPNDPEDMDGFEDNDGCPDLDNDKDGIPDKQDKCPNEPETLNGYKDDDGCPDPGAPIVVLREDKIDIIERITFLPGQTGLSPAGLSIVKLVGMVMRGHTELARVRIDVRADGVTEATMRGRAQEVAKTLAAHCVDAKRLKLGNVSAGSSRVQFIIESRVTPKSFKMPFPATPQAPPPEAPPPSEAPPSQTP